MSLAPAAMPGHRAPSPTNVNFASNNPFRRAASPALPSPDERARMSNNPFLDPPAQAAAAQKQAQNPFGEDIFKDLSLIDKPQQSALQAGIARSGTVPTQHRPARSQEEDARRRPGPPRGPPRPRGPEQTLDIFASPPKAETRRPRRNSESSIMDREKMDEDRRRRERRKEREARREKEGKPRESKSRPKKPQGLDIIDKLDVTGIYGPGLFHHDGPFDACNPHRNRKKDYRAPMQAFPANSANNALGGSGPLNKGLDLDRFHGRGEDAFNDFSARAPEAPQKQTTTFNPTDRVEQLHGAETEGLGTSTFLEGASASRRDVKRRESESEGNAFQGGGLSRKKSLAVRLRGLSQNRRDMSNERGVMSPDARYVPGSPNSPGQAVSAGGPSRSRFAPGQEKNPFFADYDDAYEKKGAQIRIADTANTGRARAPSSPHRNGLTRSITADSAAPRSEELPERGTGGGSGFLSRMKSLKGGRRARPERRAS